MSIGAPWQGARARTAQLEEAEEKWLEDETGYEVGCGLGWGWMEYVEFIGLSWVGLGWVGLDWVGLD